MADNRTTELREAARSIQGNLGRCLYRHKDVDEMRKVSDLLFEAASTIESLRDRLQAATLGEKPRDKTEEWLLNACNQAARDYVAQLEQERDELKQLVRDLIPFVCADDGIEGIEARVKELRIEVIDG